MADTKTIGLATLLILVSGTAGALLYNKTLVGAYRWLSMGTLKEIDADCFAKQYANASYYYLEKYGDYCREVAE